MRLQPDPPVAPSGHAAASCALCEGAWSDAEGQRRIFHTILKEDGHENPPAFQYYLDQLASAEEIEGRDVLEIGSGRGLLSLYGAMVGARRVVSLEPEREGSRTGALALQRERRDRMRLAQLQILPAELDAAELPAASFDLIIMAAVINHLCETRLPLTRDSVAYQRYLEIAKRIHSLLRPEGQVVITDAIRYSFWTQARHVGLPKRLCYTRLRSIDWRLHQQPAIWAQLFRQAGFARCEIHYPVPYRLRWFARLMNTRFMAWFLQGEFILRLSR